MLVTLAWVLCVSIWLFMQWKNCRINPNYSKIIWRDAKHSFWVITFVCLFFNLFFLMGSYQFSSKPIDHYSLSTLKDSTRISGDFFLGSGHIGTNPIFIACVNETDSSGQTYKRIFQTKNSNKIFVHIYEDTPINPYINIIYSSFGNFWTTWGITIYDVQGYEFHIPPNSVINNINIDLE